ncbi:uncharacterized protein IWZ02DRAFT_290315 [Phyllosticta citriasiana]|uniref:Uncharacterized protein n=1 Tax=Phyllosticta citriasiana TaxID=595635 RepID=A0ABR1KJU0_9PEZI
MSKPTLHSSHHNIPRDCRHRDHCPPAISHLLRPASGANQAHYVTMRSEKRLIYQRQRKQDRGNGTVKREPVPRSLRRNFSVRRSTLPGNDRHHRTDYYFPAPALQSKVSRNFQTVQRADRRRGVLATAPFNVRRMQAVRPRAKLYRNKTSSTCQRTNLASRMTTRGLGRASMMIFIAHASTHREPTTHELAYRFRYSQLQSHLQLQHELLSSTAMVASCSARPLPSLGFR